MKLRLSIGTQEKRALPAEQRRVARFRGLFREAVEDVHEFGQPACLLRLSLDDAVRHASLDVELENRETDAVKRRFRGGKLLQKLDTQSGS